MADSTVRNGPERSRINTLTQAALNAGGVVDRLRNRVVR